MAIYRVAEEAFSNVLKHARATRVDMVLDCPSDNKVTLTISDNGCGFDAEAATPSFGILSMEDYCGAVGGTVKIESAIAKGTSIIASFPLAAKKPRSTAYNDNDTLDGLAPALPSNGNGNGSSTKYPTARNDGKVTTLIVVDDQPDFCGLVEDLLKPYTEFKILAKGHDGSTALRLVEELTPDVVLLDVEMPGLHGIKCRIKDSIEISRHASGLDERIPPKEDLEGDLDSGSVEFISKAEFSVNRFRQACRRTSSAQLWCRLK